MVRLEPELTVRRGVGSKTLKFIPSGFWDIYNVPGTVGAEDVKT